METPRCGAKDGIARAVASNVVDSLEPVEVDEEHGHLGCLFGSSAKRVLEAVAEEGAVGEAGEPIVRGPVEEFRFGPKTLRLVAHGPNAGAAVIEGQG